MKSGLTLCWLGLLLTTFAPAAQTASPVRFEKLILTDQYYCDGINAGDFNRDGKMDIVVGPFWYEGPEFKRRREFYPAKVFETAPSPTDSMFSFVYDFNGDGWADILVLGRVHLHEGFWYENPGEKGAPLTPALSPSDGARERSVRLSRSDGAREKSAGHWKKHFVARRVQGESPPFVDVDGDSKPELVTHNGTQWGLLGPNWKKPTEPWMFRAITAKGKWDQFYHGTGVGDINGDGRLDVILNDGWWEQPPDWVGAKEWKAHAFVFSKDKGGVNMFTYDVDGDGDADVITAMNAHGWGLSWFEQVREGGEISFREHKIMGSRAEEAKYGVAFSQPHALDLADIDGDGLRDIVVGKRRWAHGPNGDIEPNEAPVIYWFQLVRTPGQGAKYIPHLIDSQSGVGAQIVATDVNGDGRADILTASKLGAFVFLNHPAETKPVLERTK